MEGLGAGDMDAMGYGGFASSTNPFWDNFASSTAKSVQQQNPGKIVNMLGNGTTAAYDNYLGPDSNGKPDWGRQSADYYGQNGQFTHSRLLEDHRAGPMALAALISAISMGTLAPAAGGAAGSMGGAGAAGAVAGDAFMPAMLGAEGAGMGGLAGLEGYLAGTGTIGSIAGDAYLPGALGGDAMMPGYLSLNGATPTGLAGLDAYAVGGGLGAAGGAGGSAAGNGGLMESITTAAKHPLAPLGGSLAMNALTGGSQSGLTGSDLASIVAGAMDYRGQKGASEDMLKYMREQQGKIDSMYQPGSPEWDYMWEAMSRKDAAAGRNSQYGPRAVDFMGRVADTKAKYTAELTKGLAGNYQQAFNQQASAPAGLSSAMQSALSNPQNLSSILNWITSGGSGGPSGVPEWDQAWANMGGGSTDQIDYGQFI